MKSGFPAPGFCGRCGRSLIGKVKADEVGVKPGQKGWAKILDDPKNFKLFGCSNCGTESTHLEDLTALIPQLELELALQRKAMLEKYIPFYKKAIPKMKEELTNIEGKLPELKRKVGEG